MAGRKGNPKDAENSGSTSLPAMERIEIGHLDIFTILDSNPEYKEKTVIKGTKTFKILEMNVGRPNSTQSTVTSFGDATNNVMKGWFRYSHVFSQYIYYNYVSFIMNS